MLGFGLLALSYWDGLGWDKKHWWLPWLHTILYATTDEFHQIFVPGRHPSPIDIGIDSTGSGLVLIILYVLGKRKDHLKGKWGS